MRLAASFAFVASTTPALALQLDSRPEEDAVAALSVRAYVRAEAQGCEQQSPGDAWLLRAVEYFWESDYLAAFRAADALVAAMPTARRDSVESRIEASTSRSAIGTFSPGIAGASGCRDLFGRLADNQHRHDLLGGGVSERLEAIYAARRGGAESVRREVQREDLVVGCTKSALRSGKHDFDATHGFCSCTVDAVAAAATPAEMDAYVAAQSSSAQDNGAAVAAVLRQPWMQQAIPKIKACLPAAR